MKSTGDFFEDVLKISNEKLGIPKEVIKGLPNEDDWSFIIKLNALVEQLFTFLLCDNLKDQYLSEHLIKLPLSKKIYLAQKKGIIDNDIQEKFEFILKLRNEAAHNIIFKFFRTESLRREYSSKFRNTWYNTTLTNGQSVVAATLTEENPKITLFFECIGCLAMMTLNNEIKIFEFEKEHVLKKLEAQKILLKRFSITKD